MNSRDGSGIPLVWKGYVMICRELLLALAATVLACGQATAAEELWKLEEHSEAPPDEVHVYKTVGERKLEIWLNYPPGWQSTEKHSALIYFFGGGWAKGAVGNFQQQTAYLASRGLVVARADYRTKNRDRVSPNVCVEDARSAIRWLRRNAAILGIDPSRVIACGDSAGGHLAACLAIPTSVEGEGEDLSTSTVPDAMVLFNPFLNFFEREEMIDSRLGGDRDLARKISPTLHLNERNPPALILFGTADKLKGQGDNYRDKAKRLGVRVDEYTAPYAGHSFWVRPTWSTLTLIATDQFLTSLGYLSGEPTLKVPTQTELRRAIEDERKRQENKRK